MIKKSSTIIAILLFALYTNATDLRKHVEASLEKGVAFFYTTNRYGGYVYNVTPDLLMRWGEDPIDEHSIEVEPPGTPAVGQAFLRAYKATGNKQALAYAKEAAYALVKGQNKYGGWEHTINFKELSHRLVSFDDNQSQSGVSFLMAMDQAIEDTLIANATQRALKMMITTQLSNGGWPHYYPEQGNYHDYATFNDAGINDCVRVMIEAYRFYNNYEAIEKSLRKATRFMIISQLPPPQPGWAQQYNEFLQPAWARSFEPASVCPRVTVRNIETLIDLYLTLGDNNILDPIPDAVRWLREIRMENGKWARFVELGTNKALYYDRNRIRVDKLEDLHIERRGRYAYETDIEEELEASSNRYKKAMKLGSKKLWEEENSLLIKEQVTERLDEIIGEVERIIKSQDSSGAWITKNDRFRKTTPKGVRWNGQYLVMDRVKSAVFNYNIAVLSEYIELIDKLDSFD